MRPPGRGEQALTMLDIGLVVSRVTEIVSTSHSFSNAMRPGEKDGALHIVFKWKGLANRRIEGWANPRRYFPSSNLANQDEVESKTVIPLNAPKSSLCQYVLELVRPLVLIFGPSIVIS
jgi:hypothetical protein